MSRAEKYTPDEVELRDAYAQVMEEYAGENYDQAKADAERGIAKLKAEVLREFADEWGDGGEGFPFAYLHERADELEKGQPVTPISELEKEL